MNLQRDDFIKTSKSLAGIINRTPLQSSRSFEEISGCRVYLKPECLQKNGSFKIRGACSALASLSKEQRDRGVITSSGGNWAQGVAYGCQLLGIKALIVMAEHVSKSKLSATKSYGAETVLFGASSSDIIKKVQELRAQKGLTWIHAFNEPEVLTEDKSFLFGCAGRASLFVTISPSSHPQRRYIGAHEM